jgi:hypothetical protein
MGMILETQERRHTFARHQPHAATGPAVTPVRPAPGYVGFPPKRDRASPAVTGLDMELCFIDKP